MLTLGFQSSCNEDAQTHAEALWRDIIVLDPLPTLNPRPVVSTNLPAVGWAIREPSPLTPSQATIVNVERSRGRCSLLSLAWIEDSGAIANHYYYFKPLSFSMFYYALIKLDQILVSGSGILPSQWLKHVIVALELGGGQKLEGPWA